MHEEVFVEEPEREGDDPRASGAGVAGNKRRYVAESLILSPFACKLTIGDTNCRVRGVTVT